MASRVENCLWLTNMLGRPLNADSSIQTRNQESPSIFECTNEHKHPSCLTHRCHRCLCVLLLLFFSLRFIVGNNLIPPADSISRILSLELLWCFAESTYPFLLLTPTRYWLTVFSDMLQVFYTGLHWDVLLMLWFTHVKVGEGETGFWCRACLFAGCGDAWGFFGFEFALNVRIGLLCWCVLRLI